MEAEGQTVAEVGTLAVAFSHGCVTKGPNA